MFVYWVFQRSISRNHSHNVAVILTEQDMPSLPKKTLKLYLGIISGFLFVMNSLSGVLKTVVLLLFWNLISPHGCGGKTCWPKITLFFYDSGIKIPHKVPHNNTDLSFFITKTNCTYNGMFPAYILNV